MPIPTCPTDCNNNLPVVSFDDCAPSINGSQVAKLYITNVGNPLADWTDPLEWNNRLDDAAIAADAIRTLHVIGSKDKPGANIKDISLKRKFVGEKDHVLNIKVDETNDINHEMVREFECGGNVLLWYETLEGKLFGGTEGIKAFLEMDMIIPESADEIITFEGTASWQSKFTEERIDSPI